MKQQNQSKQIAGFIYSPDWIAQPERMEPYVRLAKSHGYSLLIAFVRHMHRNVLSPAVHNAVKASARIVHRHGLKFVLDTDPEWWGMEWVEQHPETAMWVIRKATATADNGMFTFELPFPYPSGGQHVFHELTALYCIKNGRPSRLSMNAFRYEWQCRGKSRNQTILISGRILSRFSGQIVAYGTFKDFHHIDMSHPSYMNAQRRLLNQYRDVPLDGVGWDEPGKGQGDMTAYKAGEGFLRFFKRRNGYDLRNDLIFLDEFDATPRAVKVRLDYYDTLTEMNYLAQKAHNDHARRLFGRGIFLGTHQTWSGLCSDLPSGVADYYKLGQVLSAAFVDTWWGGEPKNVSYNYLLADGLRKELRFTEAYSNDWDRNSNVVDRMQFFNRFKMLFHIQWFNIFYSDYPEGEVNFKLPPLNKAVAPDVNKLDAFDRFLGPRTYAHTDIAMWHGWESIAWLPKFYVRSYYTFLQNTSHILVDRNLYADFISSDGILKAKLRKGAFEIDGRHYRVLLLPYAAVLPECVYRKTLDMARHGVAVLYIGTPPQFTAEQARPLAADFARQVGIQPIPLDRFTADYLSHCPRPQENEWEPASIDYHYPIRPTLAIPGRNAEEEISWVKHPAMPLYYLSMPDPHEELTDLLETLVTPPITAYSDRAHYRIYKHSGQPQVMTVVAVSKIKSTLDMVLDVGDGMIKLKGGTWCALRFRNNRIEDWIGDTRSVLTRDCRAWRK